MKYLILVALCAWLGYEIYVLIRTVIQKKKAKKLQSVVVEDNKKVDQSIWLLILNWSNVKELRNQLNPCNYLI